MGENNMDSSMCESLGVDMLTAERSRIAECHTIVHKHVGPTAHGGLPSGSVHVASADASNEKLGSACMT